MSEDKSRPAGAHITDFSHRTSLAELVACLRHARWVISVDSGPMHIAAAVNDNTLGLPHMERPAQGGPVQPAGLGLESEAHRASPGLYGS